MTKIRKRNEISIPSTIKFNFDIAMLNILILYTQCDFITRTELYNLYRLMSNTDEVLYEDNVMLQSRIILLKIILKAMVENGIYTIDLLKAVVQKEHPQGLSSLEGVTIEKNKLNTSETSYISNFVLEKLQYFDVYQNKDKLIRLLESIDENNDFNISYVETLKEIKDVMGEVLVSLQKTEKSEGLIREFAFSEDDAKELLSNILFKAKKPTSVLYTGIRQLNAILSPGFQSGRLYCILGGSGKFKSGTLLNIADQIRLFNPQIKSLENGMRKCILFITLENSIEETIERLLDMYSDMDTDIRNMDLDQMIYTLKEVGGLTFNNEEGIDICFHYAENLEISTADIYSMVTKLQSKGYSPICIVLDYIKRINSAHNANGDERVRMSFVAKELKTIAEHYQIPVITAMQLNREGNSIIDSAMRDSKADVARFVGSSSIGNAWDIIEDSDWVCLINLELQKSTQRLFLTFKRLKIRGKSAPNTTEYFNHPFINAKNIRLEPDVNKDKSISIVSLSNDLESIEEEEDEENNTSFSNIQQKNREKKSSTSIINSLKGTMASNLL